MKILITGGNRGLGKELFDEFQPESVSVSRANGYDIGTTEGRKRIVEKSLDFDIFVNNAHNGHLEGQTRLLYEIFEAWLEAGKQGYIFNIGSISARRPGARYQRYAVIKKALEAAHFQCCKKIENGFGRMRMTLLTPGMLDTEESRLKSHWGGNGVRGGDVAKIIRQLYGLPPDLLVNEVVLTAILPANAAN